MKSYQAEFDEASAPKIGVILLQADETLEGDLRHALPSNVECHVTRAKSAQTVSAASLKAIESQIYQAATLFPSGKSFDAVAFACTSGSVEIGSHNVEREIKRACKTNFATNPFDALLAKLKDENISSIAVLSPYIEEVNQKFLEALKSNGVQVAEFGSFNVETEAQVVRISSQSIKRAAMDLMKNEKADALFISCTNIRTFSILNNLAQQIEKPVYSSNQVLIWHLKKLVGIETARL